MSLYLSTDVKNVRNLKTMEDKWKLQVLGTRGSYPMSAAEYTEFGGSTSCMAVELHDTVIVFDAGSGLMKLGQRLKGQKKKKRIDIFLSHMHMDHIIGLFGFPQFFEPDMEIHLYGEPRNGAGFKEQLERVMGPPYWPVGIDGFKARTVFHEIGPGEKVSLPGEISVSALRGNHPDESLLFRMEKGKKILVYGLDCEMDPSMERELQEFAKNAELLIFDANYLPKDLDGHEGWGHSTWEAGIRLARAAGVKRILMTHYSWEYTDEILKGQEKMAKHEYRECMFAREGMEITV